MATNNSCMDSCSVHPPTLLPPPPILIDDDDICRPNMGTNGIPTPDVVVDDMSVNDGADSVRFGTAIGSPIPPDTLSPP
jgi:hypothetical protein